MLVMEENRKKVLKQMMFQMFIPSRNSGFQHDIPLIRCKLNKAVDFFYLFFTEEMIDEICKHTNAYAWSRITEKQTYAEKDGSWNEVKPA